MGTHNSIGSRLFLAADLIGSTARKQIRGNESWTGDVLAFYQQFPTHLTKAIRTTIEETTKLPAGFDLVQQPELWKAVGDELIYSVPVENEHHVFVMVRAWILAMRETERNVLSKPDVGAKGMDLKGGAWIATFPHPDRAIAVPLPYADYDADLDPEVINRNLLDEADDESGAPRKIRIDYLGPSIDTGFRVASVATARQFPITTEVAWAIALSELHRGQASETYFAGEVGLKGVWSGRGYPLFWLDTGNHHEAQALIDTISGLAAIPSDQIRDLAQDLQASQEWPCPIYLPTSSFDEVKQVKESLEARYEELALITDTSGDALSLNGEDDSAATD